MGDNEKICLNKRLIESEEGLCSMGLDSWYGGLQRLCFIYQWISPLSPIVGQTFHVQTDFLELWLSLRAVTLIKKGPPTSGLRWQGQRLERQTPIRCEHLERRGGNYILIYSHYIPWIEKKILQKSLRTTVNPIAIASVPPTLASEDQAQNPAPHSIYLLTYLLHGAESFLRS